MFAGSRFVVAGGLLLVWYRLTSGRFDVAKADWFSLVRLGFMVIAVCFGLIFWGEQFVSSGVTAVLVQGLIPLSMFAFGWMRGQNRLGLTSGGGILLGITGLLIIFFPTLRAPENALEVFGLVAITVGTVVYCWGSVISDNVLSKYPAALVAGFENFFGGTILITASLVLERSELGNFRDFFSTPVALSWVFLVFIGSLAGFTAYIYLLKEWGAARTSVYAFITPVIALAIGASLYGEQVGATEIAGAATILLGVWVTTRLGAAKERRKRNAEISPAGDAQPSGAPTHE